MTQVPDKPSIDEVMKHFGTMGMHWGVRKSKSTTGVSRSSGALMDRNARQIKLIADIKSGEKYKRTSAFGKKVIGEKQYQANLKKSVRDIKAQNARLKLGQTTAMDRLDKFANLNPASLVISRTPKN